MRWTVSDVQLHLHTPPVIQSFSASVGHMQEHFFDWDAIIEDWGRKHLPLIGISWGNQGITANVAHVMITWTLWGFFFLFVCSLIFSCLSIFAHFSSGCHSDMKWLHQHWMWGGVFCSLWDTLFYMSVSKRAYTSLSLPCVCTLHSA